MLSFLIPIIIHIIKKTYHIYFNYAAKVSINFLKSTFCMSEFSKMVFNPSVNAAFPSDMMSNKITSFLVAI